MIIFTNISPFEWHICSVNKLATFSKFLDETGKIASFGARFLTEWFRPRYEIKEFFNQCYIIGYKSFPLVGLTGLGSMKVTEQIDAMEVSGTNPFKYLVVTRVLATTLMLPILVLLSDAISLYGSYLGVNIKGVTSFSLFWNQVFDNLLFSDVLPAFIKTFFFGFTVGLIGCYKGYHSEKGTEGVGRSANSAVVVSSVLIFVIDLLVVQFTDILGIA